MDHNLEARIQAAYELGVRDGKAEAAAEFILRGYRTHSPFRATAPDGKVARLKRPDR